MWDVTNNKLVNKFWMNVCHIPENLNLNVLRSIHQTEVNQDIMSFNLIITFKSYYSLKFSFIHLIWDIYVMQGVGANSPKFMDALITSQSITALACYEHLVLHNFGEMPPTVNKLINYFYIK